MYLDFCLNYKQNRITRLIAKLRQTWFVISHLRCALCIRR